MKPSRLTVRARITGGSLLIAIAISIVAGVIIYAQVDRIVRDGQLRVLESIEGPYVTALGDNDTEEIDQPARDQLVAIISPDATTQVDTLPAALASQLPKLAARTGEATTITTTDGTYLVKTTRVPAAGGTWTIVTAADDQSASVLRSQVAWLLIASIAGINLAFGAASWFIGTAALRPVGQLRRSAAALVNTPGDELLPVGPARDEISQLAITLNELIEQLRTSAERERQIVSDASHELRTPLAIMRTQLELAQAQATTLDAMKSDVAATQTTLGRLADLAESLLVLSRIDAQAAPGHSSTAELVAELADAADRARLRVSSRDIRIDYSDAVGTEDRAIAVSVADFGRVCDNLATNAIAAIGDSGHVELGLSIAEDALVLQVTDDAGGMDPAFVAHAFDRFSRPDTARGGEGAGLGLSIVSGIAAVAGGSVQLHNRPGHGLTVEVRFPVTTAADRPA